MPEGDTIHDDALPLTVESLAAQLQACGLRAGQTVLVHSSLSALGWVAGGAQAVIMALLEALGADGTLMMPAHSNANTDPGQWRNPPVPEAWWGIIRAHWPAYDPDRTPTRAMGAIPELFRTWPGVIRSAHPSGSFAAHGPSAHALIDGHTLESIFGDDSPIGHLYALDGHVLLLGVGHFNNTSLHLAEFRAQWPGKAWIDDSAAMLVDGQRQRVTYRTVDLNADDFGQIGDSFEAENHFTPCRVGRAEVRFFRQRPIVDYAVRWMEANRT